MRFTFIENSSFYLFLSESTKEERWQKGFRKFKRLISNTFPCKNRKQCCLLRIWDCIFQSLAALKYAVKGKTKAKQKASQKSTVPASNCALLFPCLASVRATEPSNKKLLMCHSVWSTPVTPALEMQRHSTVRTAQATQPDPVSNTKTHSRIYTCVYSNLAWQ